MPPKKTTPAAKKNKVGPPTFKPTDEQRLRIEQGAAIGIPQEDMAKLLGIDAKTLRKHFREELDNGSTKANMVVGGALFNKAKGGDTSALIFWAKTRMGWKETNTTEHTGKEGGPIVMWGGRIGKDISG